MRVVKFWTEFTPGKDPVDWVMIAPQGEDFLKTQTPVRIRDLDPDGFKERRRTGDSYTAAQARWTIIKPSYEAWKKGCEIPEDGTPLEAWSAITPEVAAALKALDVRTVEEVRSAGDAVLAKLRVPNARRLPGLAAKFLDGRTGAEKDLEIEDLREKMRLLEEAVNQKPRRGPGRPKKVEEDA